MKKVIKVIIISLFTIFSFYYTNRVIDFSKNEDPIMQEITKQKSLNEMKPVNGIIEQNTITVGKSGKIVDVGTSYEKMKKLNEYNESLLEYISIKPNITKNENYEKLIVGTSTDERKISIVFTIDDIDVLKQIIYIAKKQNIQVTFFMDTKFIEDNISIIKEILTNNISLGIYSYNNNFDNISTKYVKSYLSKNFNYSNYCLYKDDKFLNACKYYKINTIKPIIIEKNLYLYFKKNKEKGAIYIIKSTRENIRQLNSTFIYLKQKGYEIIKLDDLLKE